MFRIFIKNELNYKEKKKIFELKNQFWNFGLKEQKKWFKNNIKKKRYSYFFSK